MKIYVAGPMTGLPGFNYPAFHAAAAALREIGYEAVNPAEPLGTGLSYEECLRRGLRSLLECEAVALLPGWPNSRGAVLEASVAMALKMDVRNLEDWLT